jgi:hypothetical protein
MHHVWQKSANASSQLTTLNAVFAPTVTVGSRSLVVRRYLLAGRTVVVIVINVWIGRID